jgi:transposase
MVTRNKRSPAEKTRIVMESLTTNISVAELCRKYNVSPPTFYEWKEKFVEGGKASLDRTSKGDVCRSLQKENESLKRLIGDLTVANDAFKKTLEGSKR